MRRLAIFAFEMDREEWCQEQASIQVMVAFQMPVGIHVLARMLLKQNQDWKPRSPEPILGKDILGEHMSLVPSCMHVNQVNCLCAKEARSPIVLYSQLKLDSLKLSTNFSMT